MAPGNDDTYKQLCEVVERRAEVGGGSSSDDDGVNITPFERRASSRVCTERPGTVAGLPEEGYLPARLMVVRPSTDRSAGVGGQPGWRRGMPSVDCPGESRMRENLTSGSGRGRWKRSGIYGDGLSPRWETPGTRQPGLRVIDRHRASALLHCRFRARKARAATERSVQPDQ